MCFLMKSDELLENYQKKFDSKPVYKKNLKTKIKSYRGKINTNFHNNKVPKEDSQCTCLSVIFIDKKIKAIILKCFQKYGKMLLKKKRYLAV